MTHTLQPLDLTVNGYAKRLMHEKLNDWYSLQISIQSFEERKLLHDIDAPLKLSLLKPIHAQWMLELYNKMTATPDKEIIHSAQKDVGIVDALNNRTDGLEYYDSFHDINPVMEQSQEHKTLWELCSLTVKQLTIAYSQEDEDDSHGFHWESEVGGNNFERKEFNYLGNI